jgi:hypothetical protein
MATAAAHGDVHAKSLIIHSTGMGVGVLGLALILTSCGGGDAIPTGATGEDGDTPAVVTAEMSAESKETLDSTISLAKEGEGPGGLASFDDQTGRLSDDQGVGIGGDRSEVPNQGVAR